MQNVMIWLRYLDQFVSMYNWKNWRTILSFQRLLSIDPFLICKEAFDVACANGDSKMVEILVNKLTMADEYAGIKEGGTCLLSMLIFKI